MYSNAYIFKYSSILVVVAAAVLSSAAMFLKPMQETNMAIEKMDGILASAEIKGEGGEQTIRMFNEYVSEAIVVDENGEVVDSEGSGKLEQGLAFQINLKEELYNKRQGEPYQLPIFVVNKDGEMLYIFPLLGNGLWGNIYGNMAVKDDFSTIYGVTFSHDKETPGLGAEIVEDFFTDQFISKQLFDDTGNFTSVKVVKGGASTLPPAQQIHGVDAISGGTITSVGVDEMLKDVLEAYLPYIEKQRT
jgi:Na+-transporting NADH:ubiquinone oxidoreductase subunit C